MYIGSASGNSEGIWQRWSSYAKFEDPTGGNKGFRQILNDLGNTYIRENFTYSIIEIFDNKTKSEVIIEREAYWKKVFLTRIFGMNSN